MHAPAPGQFDLTWQEELRLRNGRRVILRLLQPSDRATYLRAFHKLSAEARYHRFFEPKDDLTDQELHYLVDLDQVHHFAIVAISPGSAKHKTVDEGVGLARCVEIPGHPHVAEPAVTVLDTWQGVGLGRLLMRRLVEAAKARGVQRFHVDVLEGNAPMLSLLDEVSVELMPAREDGSLTLDLPLPDDLPPDPREDAMHDRVRLTALDRVLRMAAKGVLRVLPRAGRGKG